MERVSLLRLLHERSLGILEGISWQVSDRYLNKEQFADVAKSFEDEVIRMRLWGKEVDADTMLVVEDSSELRSVVAALLQQVSSMLLNCACIRPPSGWRSQEYQELKILHVHPSNQVLSKREVSSTQELVESDTNVEIEQSQHDGFEESAPPYLEIVALKELIVNLRCCTGTLMDIVPVIEHTKHVLTGYMSPRHVLRTQQTSNTAPIFPSAQDIEVKSEVSAKIKTATQRFDVSESQSHVSDTSSRKTPTHAADDTDSGKVAIQDIVSSSSHHGEAARGVKDKNEETHHRTSRQDSPKLGSTGYIGGYQVGTLGTSVYGNSVTTTPTVVEQPWRVVEDRQMGISQIKDTNLTNARFDKGDRVRKMASAPGVAQSKSAYTIYARRSSPHGWVEYQLQDYYTQKVDGNWTRERDLKAGA